MFLYLIAYGFLQERMSDMHSELWKHHSKTEDSDKRQDIVQAAARIRHRLPLFEGEMGHEEPYVPVSVYFVQSSLGSVVGFEIGTI